ncbi:SCO family protein [Cumulibacter manganitolerans]|uniref:SCO family protein n=1 Tax=Cumulibacter manganitolerans TaxID=1884992 RepID=UPI001294AA99|nr:SCO family protein [Cumulibacter manganitolerans]
MLRRLRSTAALLVGASLALTGCAASDQGGGVASVSQVANDSAYRGVELNPEWQRPSFTLTDQTGQPYDFKARTTGVPTILYFGYTHCPDVCPLIMGQLSAAIDAAPKDIRSKLQVVFVSTDPVTDTPPVLASYLSKFDGALPVKYVGLTGDVASVEAAQSTTGVPVAEDGGKTHSTMAIYYGTSNEAHVAWLANTNADDIGHDLPIGVK